MPATVNTPPTMAEVVVTKWYHGRVCSATMIWMGDRSYENCARAVAAPVNERIHGQSSVGQASWVSAQCKNPCLAFLCSFW